MACTYADHCMRLLTRSFFPIKACVDAVVPSATSCPCGRRGGVRPITEGPLIKLQGMWVRRAPGAPCAGVVRTPRAHLEA